MVDIMVMTMNMIKKIDEVVVMMMMKDQCHCPGSVRVHRQDHSVCLKSRHLLVLADAHLGLCALVLKFKCLRTKTGMKHPIFNLPRARKSNLVITYHNGSTPAAARVGDKYGTGQILQEQVRLENKYCPLLQRSNFHLVVQVP